MEFLDGVFEEPSSGKATSFEALIERLQCPRFLVNNKVMEPETVKEKHLVKVELHTGDGKEEDSASNVQVSVIIKEEGTNEEKSEEISRECEVEKRCVDAPPVDVIEEDNSKPDDPSNCERTCVDAPPVDVTAEDDSKLDHPSKFGEMEKTLGGSDGDVSSTADTIDLENQDDDGRTMTEVESSKEELLSNTESCRDRAEAGNSDENEDDGNKSKAEEQMVSGPRPSLLREGPGIAALLAGIAEPPNLYQKEGFISRKDRPPEEAAIFAAIEKDIAAAAKVPRRTRGRTAEKGGPSSYRGVVWHKSNNKWEARIYENGKQRFLGYFTNEDEAALSYDEQALRLHGRNAKLNFPDHWKNVQLPPAHIYPGRGLKSSVTKVTKDGGDRLNKKATISASRLPRNVIDKITGKAQPTKGTSQFRGVSWNSSCSKWRAQVWKGSDVHHLGYYEDEVDAARAYDEAVIRIRGPDAPTNFPRSDYSVSDNREDVIISGNEDTFSRLSRLPLVNRAAEKVRQLEIGARISAEEGIRHSMKISSENGLSSRMLGVSWNSQNDGWTAEIWDGTSYKDLGVYASEVEAARAYDMACLKQHGADALTNFPLHEYEMELAALALKDLAASDDSATVSNDGEKNESKATDYVVEQQLKHTASGMPQVSSQFQPGSNKEPTATGFDTVGLQNYRNQTTENQRLKYLSLLNNLTNKGVHNGAMTEQFVTSNVLDMAKNGLKTSYLPGTRSPRMENQPHNPITWDAMKQRWAVQIQCEGKNIHLGHFSSPKEAIAAHDMASHALKGYQSQSQENILLNLLRSKVGNETQSNSSFNMNQLPNAKNEPRRQYNVGSIQNPWSSGNAPMADVALQQNYTNSDQFTGVNSTSGIRLQNENPELLQKLIQELLSERTQIYGGNSHKHSITGPEHVYRQILKQTEELSRLYQMQQSQEEQRKKMMDYLKIMIENDPMKMRMLLLLLRNKNAIYKQTDAQKNTMTQNGTYFANNLSGNLMNGSSANSNQIQQQHDSFRPAYGSSSTQNQIQSLLEVLGGSKVTSHAMGKSALQNETIADQQTAQVLQAALSSEGKGDMPANAELLNFLSSQMRKDGLGNMLQQRQTESRSTNPSDVQPIEPSHTVDARAVYDAIGHLKRPFNSNGSHLETNILHSELREKLGTQSTESPKRRRIGS